MGGRIHERNEVTMMMRAAREFAIGDFRTVDVEVPVPHGKELLVKVEACGICGSDIPRIYELGTSRQDYPLTIGHEFGGVIVAVGEDADPSLVGKRGAIFPCIPCRTCDSCIGANYAMCTNYDYLGSRNDGGFAEYCLVPSDWHFIESHNPELPSEALGMVEPCTVAQHAVRRSGITAGMGLLIFGAGPIGQMAARWGKIFGADPVVLVDVLDDKVEFAREHGTIAFNSMTTNVAEEFKKLSGGKLPDVVIEGTGVGAALGQCIDCCRPLGTVVMMGNPHRDTTIKLSQHSNILRKELNLKGIWNSHYADTPINEWTFTVKMMDSGAMKVDDLVTHRSNLEDLPQLCDDIYNRRVSICKALYLAEK